MDGKELVSQDRQQRLDSRLTELSLQLEDLRSKIEGYVSKSETLASVRTSLLEAEAATYRCWIEAFRAWAETDTLDSAVVISACDQALYDGAGRAMLSRVRRLEHAAKAVIMAYGKDAYTQVDVAAELAATVIKLKEALE